MNFAEIGDVLLDTLLDAAKLLPFLFLCYLLLEFLERHVDFAHGRVGRALRDGRVGPLVGGLCGVVPQCGFSAVASGLYAAHVITLGTLLAVFLSTSDEMLPILISNRMPVLFVCGVLAIKALVGMFSGVICDLIHTHGRVAEAAEEPDVEELCAHDGCHCEGHGILWAALYHTARIALFILTATLILNLAVYFVGEDRLGDLILNIPVVGHLIAALVGLIPNCAASVVLTELYLRGALSFGAMLAGLLPGAGVGLLVLGRVNRRKKENLVIVGLLIAVGVGVGLLLDLSGIEGWLLSL